MEPYADLLWDDLDGLEHEIDGSPGPSPLWRDPDEFMDPLGKMLGQMEASIEAATVPPPFEPEPLALEPLDAGPCLADGPTSPGPP
ncbi:unnamed protein product, partial [marine sediment metagenome]